MQVIEGLDNLWTVLTCQGRILVRGRYYLIGTIEEDLSTESYAAGQLAGTSPKKTVHEAFVGRLDELVVVLAELQLRHVQLAFAHVADSGLVGSVLVHDAFVQLAFV
jgi:hypothetical protein